MSTGKVLLGTLAEFAIGAIAGVLFAPEKGSTTRQQILEKADYYAGKLKSGLDEFCGSLANKVESAKKDAVDLARKGREKFEDMKSPRADAHPARMIIGDSI